MLTVCVRRRGKKEKATCMSRPVWLHAYACDGRAGDLNRRATTQLASCMVEARGRRGWKLRSQERDVERGKKTSGGRSYPYAK